MLEEFGKFVAVGGKGARGVGTQTLTEDFEGTIKPDGDAVFGDEAPILSLHERSAAKGHDTRMTGANLRDVPADSFGFDFAKNRFAAFGKQLRNGLPLLLFDFGVDVDKRPADFLRKSAAHG